MPRPPKYNKIDDEKRREMIEAVIQEGLTVAQTSKRFNIPYSTIKNIVMAFQEGADAPKKRGGNQYPVVNEVHIHWLTTRMDQHPELSIKDLCEELNQVFKFHRPVTLSAVKRVVKDINRKNKCSFRRRRSS